jgi:hypothetical protein
MPPIVVEGRMISPTQIELDEPVAIAHRTVMVEIRPRGVQRQAAVRALLQRMADRPARGRSKEDIDRQLAEERAGWEHRR